MHQFRLRRRLVSYTLAPLKAMPALTQSHSNAIISLNLVCLMWTYMTSIGCVLYRRVYHPELLPRCQWSLGRWGVPINAAALLYSTFAFFWCFWPNTTPVTADDFNWAVVMFFATFLIAGVDWVFRGRHHYDGPVVLSEGWHQE
jgi:choline transport protein